MKNADVVLKTFESEVSKKLTRDINSSYFKMSKTIRTLLREHGDMYQDVEIIRIVFSNFVNRYTTSNDNLSDQNMFKIRDKLLENRIKKSLESIKNSDYVNRLEKKIFKLAKENKELKKTMEVKGGSFIKRIYEKLLHS